jgi:hypothetical protein
MGFFDFLRNRHYITLHKNQPIAYGWASYLLASKYAFVNESGVAKEIMKLPAASSGVLKKTNKRIPYFYTQKSLPVT